MEYPSIDKAKKILELYDEQRTKAHTELLSGVNYDGMPKGSPKGNPSTDAVAERISSHDFIKTVRTAVDLVGEDFPEYAIALKECYFQHKTKTAIAFDIHVHRTTVYDIMDKALMEFANIIPDNIYESTLVNSF